jgi:hypothetical protein
MSSDAGQAWFRLGMFLVLMALVILPFQDRNSAEFVVTVLALVTGLLMLAIVALIIKLSNR